MENGKIQYWLICDAGRDYVGDTPVEFYYGMSIPIEYSPRISKLFQNHKTDPDDIEGCLAVPQELTSGWRCGCEGWYIASVAGEYALCDDYIDVLPESVVDKVLVDLPRVLDEM